MTAVTLEAASDPKVIMQESLAQLPDAYTPLLSAGWYKCPGLKIIRVY
jgi:hypothetical protein